MFAKLRFLIIFVALLGSIFLFGACRSSSEETPASAVPQGLNTSLLVRAPDTPLPVKKPIIVRSRTEDLQGVSHVELRAVQTPAGETDILIRADQAPFFQTSFTAAQTFTPLQPGHYVIKVVGYNVVGEHSDSDFIGFDVQ